LSFTSRWLELENIILSEVSQAPKAKDACSPSCAFYRPKTNAAILWNSLRGGHAREGLGKGRKLKN
jgi:hypothetical protein